MEIWPWQEQTKRAMRKVFEENMGDWHRLTIDRDTEKENLGKKKGRVERLFLPWVPMAHWNNEIEVYRSVFHGDFPVRELLNNQMVMCWFTKRFI